MKRENITLISDVKVTQIPVKDCNEPLVDCLDFNDIFADTSRKHVQKISDSISKVRHGIIDKLRLANHYLPNNLHLLIKEAYRPVSIQKAIYESHFLYVKKQHPDWNSAEIAEETSKYVAPDRIAPHATGGAIDLTLIDSHMQEIEMGTEFNESPDNCHNACFTHAKNISVEAYENRKVLINAMTLAGFVNYPTEWWHWSYGDRYWAHAKNVNHAIYNIVASIKENNIRE